MGNDDHSDSSALSKPRRFDGLRSLAQRAGELAQRVGDVALAPLRKAAERFGDHVKIDLERRRLYVADALIARFVREGAQLADDLVIEDFAWDAEAYLCRARHGARTYVGHLRVETARYSHGDVTVEGATPGGVAIEQARVETWLLSQFVRLFGGTGVARKVFSFATPPGVTWDGKHIAWRRTLDLQEVDGVTGLVAGDLQMQISVTHDGGGLWLSVDGATSDFLKFVGVLLGSLRGVVAR